MKTLEKHTLLYDEACPLCQWYTGAFVKHGLLDTEGRTQFGEQAPNATLDADRARHEIALVNRQTGTVRYGLDSLTTILAHRWPWMQRVFSTRLFQAVMNPFYHFISYNRKVIALDARPEAAQACKPDFHRGYRWAYLLVAGLLAGLGFMQLGSPSPAGLGLLLIPLLWGLQALLLVGHTAQQRITYLGHLTTLLLLAVLLMLPIHFLQGWTAVHLMPGWAMAVTGALSYHHYLRVRALAVPWYLVVTPLLFVSAGIILLGMG